MMRDPQETQGTGVRSHPLSHDERSRLDQLIQKMDDDSMTDEELDELEILHDRYIDTEMPWMRALIDMCIQLAESDQVLSEEVNEEEMGL